jgi:hypothetical protein
MTVDEVRRTYGIDGDLIMGRRSKQEEVGTPSVPKSKPTHNGSALARDVFSNPHFYDGDEVFTKMMEERRLKALGDMTVKEVLVKYLEDKEGYPLKYGKTFVNHSTVMAFFRSAFDV